MWQDLVTGLPGEFETVLVIGAGASVPVDALSAHAPKRIVCIEPHPHKVKSLRRVAGPVEVIEAAVGSAPGTGQLVEYNFGEMDSLHPPTGARALFPGLRRVGEFEVPVMSVDQLAAAASLDARARNLLVIDAPAESLPVLEGLTRSGDIQAFAFVIARTSSVPLYRDAASSEALEAWASGTDFIMRADTRTADPDLWHVLLEAAQAPKTRTSSKGKSQSAKTTARKDSGPADKEQALAEQLEAQTQLRKEAARERDNARKAAKRAKARIDKLTEGLEKAELRVCELSEQCRQLDELKARNSELEQALQESEKTADRAQSDLRVSLRMQRLSQADLHDLQARYERLLSEKSEVDALLEEVVNRLGYASDYLKGLPMEEFESGSSIEFNAEEDTGQSRDKSRS